MKQKVMMCKHRKDAKTVKNKKLMKKKFLSTVIVILLLSSTIFTVYGAGTGAIGNLVGKTSERQEEYRAVKLAKQYNKSKGEVVELKNQLGSWDAVASKLYKENVKTLPEDRVLELYNQGYSLEDINKAQQLTQRTEKSVEELLELKGKAGADNTITWDDVEKKIGIYAMKPEESVGIPKDEYDALINKGFNHAQINQAYILAKNYKKEAGEIIKQMESGKTLGEIQDEYFEESLSSKSKEEKDKILKQKEESQKNIEESLRKQLGITDEEYEMLKKVGISNINDMFVAKNHAERYGVGIDKVIELKTKLGEWQEVLMELEVFTYEK